MWKKIAIGGAIAAAALGTGTAAMAMSGSTASGTPTPATTSTSTSTSAAGTAGKHPLARDLLKRAVHGQWVTTGKGGSGFVTHDAVKGDVSAISATSITVKSADNTSETYAVSSDTKVRVRANGKGAAGSISDVHAGDHVLVLGTGTSALTATGILDVK